MRKKINHYRIYFEEYGAKDGVPIIFVHAFPLDHTMWKGQIRKIPKKFRAIVYDMRGMGYSEVGDGQYSMEMMADDLIGLMDELKIPKAIVCGLSMGGYIALRAYEKEPKRFMGLILCDTRSEADTNEGKIKRSDTIKTIKEKGLGSFADGFIKNALSKENYDPKGDLVNKIKRVIEGNSTLAICGSVLALVGRTDTTNVLKKISVPTIYLVGEKDSITPPIASQSMHEQTSGSELVVIKGSGHFSNMENEGAFNKALVKFLNKF